MKSIESTCKKNLNSIAYPSSLLKDSSCFTLKSIPKSRPNPSRAIPEILKSETLSASHFALPYTHPKNQSYTRWLSSNLIMNIIGSRFIKMLSLFFILILCHSAKAQIIPIFIQLEDGYSNKILKFFPGQEIQFTTKEYPDAWRKEVIERIIPQDSTLVLSEGFLKPSDISKVRTKRKMTTAISHTLIKGAQAYYLYGAYSMIGSRLDDDPGSYIMRAGEIIVGAATGVVGWLIKKLFRYKTFKLDQHVRLRIMDIRFSTPDMSVPRA